EQERAALTAAKHDHGTRAAKATDVLLPLDEPSECLKDAAFGRAFERRPFRFEASEIIAQLERDARTCVGGLNGERRALPARQVAATPIQSSRSVAILCMQSRFALAREQSQRRVVVEHADSLR